jgi:hypothetical protein
MTTTIALAIETKTLGQRRPALDAWHMPVTLSLDPAAATPALPLRDLLTAIVTAEVAAFHDRQQARRLDRVLAPEQIEDGAARGKINAGATEPQAVSLADAITTALQAFEDRLYLVLVDGAPAQSLDEHVAVGAGSRVSFVRLVPLIGG